LAAARSVYGRYIRRREPVPGGDLLAQISPTANHTRILDDYAARISRVRARVICAIGIEALASRVVRKRSRSLGIETCAACVGERTGLPVAMFDLVGVRRQIIRIFGGCRA
jgi:hypothetical protein